MTDLRTTLGAVPVDRDVTIVSGPDAASFLQGQVSQDVEALPIGESAMSLVLQPKGKVDAWIRVSRVADDRFVVDVDAGHGAALSTRLGRFKLRVDCEIGEVETWRTLALRGPGAGTAAETMRDDDGVVAVAPVDWAGVEGADVIGPAVSGRDGVAIVGADALHVLRVEAGVPAMGRELTESTIPAEAVDVERSVSFTKGCYVGQELVVRIHSRGGQVPRPVRGLVFDGEVAPPEGAVVRVDGADVGEVTSVARSPRLGVVALAVIGRTVELGSEVTVGWAESDGTTEQVAVVAELPLVA